MVDNFQYDQFTYAYSAQLDLKGNGSVLIPLVPVKAEGTFETRAMDIIQ